MNRKITLLALMVSIGAFSQTISFVNKADKPIARSASASSKDQANDNVYIANGFSITGQNTTDIEKYNLYDDTWSLVPTTPATIGKRYGNMEVFQNFMYIFNGMTSTGINDKVELINLDTGNLVVSSALNPNPVYGGGSSIIGDRIITFGGCVSRFNGIYSNKLYIVNPYSTWEALAEMPVGLETKGEVVYGDGTNSKLYVFGGFREINAGSETFESTTTGTNIALTGWFNVAEAGTALYKSTLFGGNKYAQITAFNGIPENQEASNISWLISNSLTALGTDPVYLSFDTKDGYNNGATLQAYLITNWTGNVATSTKTLLNANIATGSTTGYAVNFTDSGDIRLLGNLGEFRIAFKYTGGYAPVAATTTYQIDNVRVFKTNVSNNIYIYDFATNTWSTSATNLPISLSAYGIARDDESNTKIYITGDYENQTFTGVFNTVDNSFTPLTQTNMIGRRHHTSEFWSNKLYIFGGNTTPAAATSLASTQAADLTALDAKTFAANAAIRMYPNPVKDVLHFDFDTIVSTISIHNSLGQEMMAKSINANEVKLDVANLPSGTYLVKVTAGSEVKTVKIIKE